MTPEQELQFQFLSAQRNQALDTIVLLSAKLSGLEKSHKDLLAKNEKVIEFLKSADFDSVELERLRGLFGISKSITTPTSE